MSASRSRRRRSGRSVTAVARVVEVLELRTLFAAVAWDGGGDGVNWDDPVNWSNNALPTGGDDVTLNVAGTPTIVLRNAQSIRSLDNQETLVIQGNGTFGAASLAMSNASSNGGTIRLTSIDSAYGASLIGTGSIDNAGTIQSQVGTGGTRAIQLDVNNHGTIDADADITCSASSRTFTQSGGSIDTSGGGSFDWQSGQFNQNGGTLGDRVSVSNGTISVAAAAPASTIVAKGSSTLLNNLSPNVTVWVQGNGSWGGAVLNVSSVASNAGTIELKSIDSAYGATINGSGTLTNSGTIRASAGTGGAREIDVNLNNTGTIDCDADVYCSASTKTWNQQGGTVDTSGGGSIRWVSGTMNWSGGTLGDRVRVGSGVLDVASTAPASTIIAEGSITLLGNASTVATVWAQGNGYFGNATLTITGVVSNSGTIRMESIDSSYSVHLAGAGTLSNGGTVRAEPGAGGPRGIDVNLNNNGAIVANTDIPCAASGKTWNQTGGSVQTAGGAFRWSGGQLNYSGGTLGSRATVSFGTINILASAPAQTVVAEGNCTLGGNASPDATVWAQGNGYGGSATLSISGSVTNAGTILLQSIDSSYSASVIGSGTLVNSGTLRAELGTGGPRDLTVNFDNSGNLTANVDMTCSTSTKTWNQSGGAVNGSGKFRWSGGTMNWSGGALNGRAYVSFGTLNVTATAPASTIILEGSTTLVQNLSADATVWLQGNGYGGGATVNLAGALTNNGHIVLSSIDSSYADLLKVAGTFTNNGTVTTPVGSGGGPRSLDFASVTGTGSIDVSSSSASLIADSVRQDALSIAGSATIRHNGGNSGLSILKNLSITGTGTFDLDNNDLILDYSGATVLPAVQTLIATARNGGNWLGTTGITSTAARSQSNTNLGAIEASDYDLFNGSSSAQFDGVDPDNTAVLVKYTYNGDANLDGRVTFDDYVRIDTGFNTHRTGWANGDFNYSGVVNFDDYVLIDIAFNSQSGALGRRGSIRVSR